MTDHKLLIFTEDMAGHGHTRAAQILTEAYRRLYPGSSVRMVRVLPLLSPALEHAVRGVYRQLIHRAPGLWGKVYESEHKLTNPVREKTFRILCRFLKTVLEKEQPHAVVCTHAFCLEALGKIKRSLRKPYRLFAVPTDFDVHSFWFHSDVDAYFVAADHTKTRLASDPGIDREHVHVTGIPVKTEFGSLPSIRNHPDEEGARPLRLLISGGGTGTGPLHAIAEALQEVSAPLNITVVAGHNEKLYRRIRRTTYSRHPVRAYGYVRHMHDLMNECDVLVSKAGGLTTTEAIVSQTPMMIYRPIPGQEARNAAWLVGEKLAVEVRDIRELVRQIEAWQRDPRPLQAMRDRMARIKKPDSTAQICRLIGRYIEN